MPISRTRFFLLLGVAAYICSCAQPPDPGYLELQRSREAIREATSWQIDTTAQYPGGQPVIVELSKVDRPGRMDRLAILREPRNKSVHEMWFDGTHYNKTEGVAVWISHPANENPFPDCGRGPSLIWDGTLYDDLATVHKVGDIRRGTTDQYDDVSCVWWEVTPYKGSTPHYKACVGQTDHLPRLVNSLEHDLHYMYTLSKWNATVITLPPEAKVIPN